MFGSYIRESDADALKTTKYVNGQPTFLDKVLDYYWSAIVLLIPKSLAPNVITLFGSFISWISVFLVVWHAQSNYMYVPRNIIIFFVAACWIQQTCDAIDGKQARRCQTFSPLGSFLDHGCDAISTTAISFATASIVNCSQCTTSFINAILSIQLVQYGIFWWEHHFGVFTCNLGTHFGVTEAQLVVMGLGIISIFMDSSFWVYNALSFLPPIQRVQIFNKTGISYIQLSDLMMIVMAICNYGSCFILFIKGFIKMSSLRIRLRALFQLIFYALFALSEVLYYDFAVCRDHSYILRIMGIWTIIFAHGILSMNILVASVTKKPYNIIQLPLLPFMIWPIFKLAIKHCSQRHPFLIYLSIDMNNYFITGIFIWTFFYIANYAISCISDMCRILNISCITVSHKSHKE